MFAVVRTGGKQYRVAPGDKIVVEKLDGNAGDKVTLGDVLLAGDGGSLKSTNGLTVAAEIVAQAKGDKVTVFKKRRRHNYRRKKGHRQQHTILRIVAIGDHKHAEQGRRGGEESGSQIRDHDRCSPGAGREKPAARAKQKAEAEGDQHRSGNVVGEPTENPAPDNAEAANAPKAAPKKAAAGQARGQNPVDKKCCTC